MMRSAGARRPLIGKVLDRARGLHAVVRVGGNLELAERIAFAAKALSHQLALALSS